jgi:ribonuclease R
MARHRPADPSPDGLPSKQAIRDFIRAAPGRVGKREISRAFGLGPQHRVALRALLADMAGEGAIAPAGHRRFAGPGRAKTDWLPEVAVVQITGTDPDGEPIARLADSPPGGRPPLILMAPEARGRPALAPGERVLARLKRIGPGRYEGRTLKRLSDAPGRVLGVFQPGTGSAPGRIVPTDRRARAEWLVPAGEAGGAEAGEIVLAAPLPGLGYGLKPARVIERLGRLGDARSVSLICIHTHDIPTEFSAAALAEAETAGGVGLGARSDLRALPLVTIDGEDARDFDDAVFAEADGEGFRLVVAIADVAHYVPAGSALDRAARERGNSVYFPDRVVPMLPEALSNGWCSLRPGEDRGCLFAEMSIDSTGRKTGHRFGRGLMRSAARLTYTEVQQAAEDGTGPLQTLLAPLYGAFRALLAARQARGTLDLDLPERRVELDDAGRVLRVAPRPRLDSHRLIEEFMVLANVAAAEELERRHLPCMYRIHAPPSEAKLAALRGFLATLGISLPAGNQLHPRDLDAILRRVAGSEQAPLVNEVMLRSQSQAAYDPENIGHFGLGLARYAHFTSPIRRYADLLVHRALIAGLDAELRDGALAAGAAGQFADIAAHITATERRAQLAEREAIDRYLAAFMADRVGAQFAARISGVTRFGLFVTVVENGASGFVPVASLPDDRWMHDETAQMLIGRRSRVAFHLAQSVEVRLAEARPVTGGLLFEVLGEAAPDPQPRQAGHAGARGRRSRG